MTNHDATRPAQTQRDFISAKELSNLTGYALNSLYNAHQKGSGPLSSILTKFGRKLGCWRGNYDQLVASQRRLQPTEQRSAA
jgi:hypothetical protein